MKQLFIKKVTLQTISGEIYEEISLDFQETGLAEFVNLVINGNLNAHRANVI